MPERSAVCVASVLCLVAAGCWSGSETGTGSGPDRTDWNVDGRKVVVRDVDGTPIAKLRRDRREWKVYDRAFVPLGEVRWEEPDVSDAGPGRGLVIFEYEGTERRRFRRARRDVWRARDRFRIERTGRGWAVYGPGAQWVGRFGRTDGVWHLRLSDRRVVRAEIRSEQWVATDGSILLRSPGESVPRAVLLALTLDELPLLDRVAVGVWIDSLPAD